MVCLMSVPKFKRKPSGLDYVDNVLYFRSTLVRANYTNYVKAVKSEKNI